MTEKIHDLVILGSGPAGMTAGIYAARYMLDTVVIGPDVGGTANSAHDLENWPGYRGSGIGLMQNFSEHLKSFGVPLIEEDVKGVKHQKEYFEVSTDTKVFKAHTLILAMGTKRRKLEVPGEEEFFGKGVSYCATCDSVFFKKKKVAVVGGGDAAAMAAQILSGHADKVIIIYRGTKMRAEPSRVKQIENDPKIDIIYSTNVLEIKGDKKVNKLKLDKGEDLEVDGIFIEIGGMPVTAIAESIGIKLSDSKRIEVTAGMETNISGVFAAGDITTGSNQFNQIVTAAAEGAIAALGAFNFIRKHKSTAK